jgi:hypothetical protein
MSRFHVALLLCLTLFALPAAADTTSDLKKIAQELLDAITAGDPTVWDRHLAENCIVGTEDGRTLDKQQMLAEIRPLPAAYKGSLTMANVQVREHGDVAIISYDIPEKLELYGQTLHTRFHSTDTYLKRDGRWRVIALQLQVLPSELEPVSVDPKLFDAYVGRYQLAPDVVYVVTREGNRLMGERLGREKEELLPKSETIFSVRGKPRGEKVFVKDSEGRFTRLIDRRDNNDLVWTRVTPEN